MIEREGIPLILIASEWSRQMQYSNLSILLADATWPHPGHQDLLSQGPIYHPASLLLALIFMSVEV